MDNLSKIKESIRKINVRYAAMFTAKVTAVDGETCSCEIDKLTFTDVRLRAVINNEQSKILVTPSVGSYVLVTDLSDGNYSNLAVVCFSEIDRIDIDVDTEIIINQGENDGIVKVIELTEKLNNIEKDINNLKSAFQNWVPAVYDGGAALKSGAASWFAQKLTETTQKDIENELIKH